MCKGTAWSEAQLARAGSIRQHIHKKDAGIDNSAHAELGGRMVGVTTDDLGKPNSQLSDAGKKLGVLSLSFDRQALEVPVQDFSASQGRRDC